MSAEAWAALAAWVGVGLSAAGAVVSWWRANLSSAARQAAETAKAEAEAARVSAAAASERAEKTLAAVEVMAAAVEGPRFSIDVIDGDTYVLRSRRSYDQTIAVVNADEFGELDALEGVMAGHQSVRFLARGDRGARTPSNLVLRVEGAADLVFVPFPT